MKRKPLLKLLETYRSRWTEERATCERFSDFVSRNPDCFERSLGEGHVTGSAWLLNGAGTHVLLTHHRKLERWFQLGGHADGEAGIAQVALKEAKEESGLSGLKPLSEEIFDIDIHRIPARRNEAEHYHYDVRFAFQATEAETFSVSEESLDLAWVAVETLSDFTQEESMLRMAAKWMSQKSVG